ncbi:MAG: leucyl/phenylalanyl-tRNA--protein transferase [Verrucomicrobiota bacterium]|nr:leucyl/phenylalanyl-tRNA--protein transferase [Verrucomicrobiota bacterium]
MSSINPEFLLQAYRMGIFPMAMEEGEIGWFSPDPRGIIPLDSFHVSKSLKRVISSGRFNVRINGSFGDVIDGCAEREETWIDETVRDSYLNLNGRGYAHSVECWLDGELAGGLYGVALGGAFFGESMFSRERDASKVALVALVEHLIKRKFILLDTQWTTSHLKQFGAIDIAKSEYMKLLHEAIAMDVSFV